MNGKQVDEQIITVDTETGEVVEEQTGRGKTRNDLLVYGWAFALALGGGELRAVTGLDFVKLAAVYAALGLFCAAVCSSITNTTRDKTGKSRVWQEIVFLLGITAIVLFYGK